MAEQRPALVVVVTGTATEVGKTWVTAGVLSELRSAGLSVAARKPAQSFDPGDDTTDADELAAASGEDPAVVCPPHRRYEVPMAPPMAADVLGRPRIGIAELATEVGASWPSRPTQLGFVEMAGAVRSPMAHDGDGVDLVGLIAPDVVVLVADAGLGTIGAVSSALDSLDTLARTVRPEVMVHLNRFDADQELHVRNRDWLAAAAPETMTLTTAGFTTAATTTTAFTTVVAELAELLKEQLELRP